MECCWDFFCPFCGDDLDARMFDTEEEMHQKERELKDHLYCCDCRGSNKPPAIFHFESSDIVDIDKYKPPSGQEVFIHAVTYMGKTNIFPIKINDFTIEKLGDYHIDGLAYHII